MRPDQCHGEPKPAEIKPDTSLYDKKGDRLRAMGAVFDAQEAGGLVQYKSRNGPRGWSDIPHATVDSLSYDYRVKPKPRELWAVYGVNGAYQFAVEGPEPKVRDGWVPVRFVEQP